MKTKFIVLLLLLSFLQIPVMAQDTNLIQNPSFEETPVSTQSKNIPAVSWETYDWKKSKEDQFASTFLLDGSKSFSGSKSLLIDSRLNNDARFQQTITVKGDAYYKLSCYIMTENVGTKEKGANISVYGISHTSTDIQGTTSDWQYVELYGKTHKKQDTLTLTVGLGGYSSENMGRAWFDDVSVERLTAPPENQDIIPLYDPNDYEPLIKTTFIGVLLALILLVGVLIYLILSAPPKSKAPNLSKPLVDSSLHEINFPRYTLIKLQLVRKDVYVMAGMTLIYLLIAIFNLGSLTAPETFWTPGGSKDTFTVDFGKSVNLSKIHYYCNIGKGEYMLEAMDASGVYKPMGKLDLDNHKVFKWKNLEVSQSVQYIRVTTKFPTKLDNKPMGILNEIGFFEEDKETPLFGFTITDIKSTGDPSTSPHLLFDEQDTLSFQPTYLDETYFDEIYHARTAYEHIHEIEPYETTHPPLGKILISLGIAIFGMNTFGWRIIGMLFGAAMIPLMYVFGKKMFGKSLYGFFSAFLMMFDFMHFAQTRISTIDVYVTFFIIVMFYFMYDYFINKSYMTGLLKSLKPLLLCGIFFGLGAASKWIALYGAAGLAFLFFISKYLEYKDYRFLKTKADPFHIPWLRHFVSRYLMITLLACTVFFILIPVLIYFASYLPFLSVQGSGHDLKGILDNQQFMYNYHSKFVLNAKPHAYSSTWWEWPFIGRPIWYFGLNIPKTNLTSSISALGNPAIWWAGIVAVFAGIIMVIRHKPLRILPILIAIAILLPCTLWGNKIAFTGSILLGTALFLLSFIKDKNLFFILTTIASQYLPWVLVPRMTFIYHYFSTIPFIILAIVYIIKRVSEKYRNTRYVFYGYLVIVAILFVMFYPVISGLPVDASYVADLEWFNSWNFWNP